MRTKPIRAIALLEKDRVLLRPNTGLLCTAPLCFGRLADEKEGLRQLCVSTPAVFTDFYHQFFLDSGTDWRVGEILWIVAASEMMVFIIMIVFYAQSYRVRTDFRVLDPRLYPSPDGMRDSWLGRLFRLFSKFLSL